MALIPCDKIPIFDRITDQIYLGDMIGASDGKLLKSINTIVCLIADPYKHFEHIRYHDLPIEDNRDYNIIDLFSKTDKIIKSSIKNGENVLIHCYNGVSRSVTILLGYLISEGISLLDGIQLIKKNREQYSRPT